MGERRQMLADLPFWPRWLARDEAARYVGVCPDVFDQEVRDGLWPPARRRGNKGGRLTWDRALLDAWSDRESALDQDATPAPKPHWGARSAATKERNQRLAQKAA